MIALRGLRDVVSVVNETLLGRVGLLSEAAVPLMVCQIVAVIIIIGDVMLDMREVQIPPHEIHRVTEVITAMVRVVSFALIPTPSGVNHLRVPIGAALSASREQLELASMVRPRVGAKTGLMPNHGQDELDGRPPVAMSLEQALPPDRAMIHHHTRLVRVIRPLNFFFA